MAEQEGVRIDPGSLRRLVQASRTWDAVSRREMRAKLRAAAMPALAAAKAEVLGAPPPRTGSSPGGRTSRGKLRNGLAAGASLSIRTGREGASGVTGEGVRVTASPKKLDANRAPMLKAYMSGSFRHPVFGTGTWVGQNGKNWFYRPLRADQRMYQAAIVAAINEASQAIAEG